MDSSKRPSTPSTSSAPITSIDISKVGDPQKRKRAKNLSREQRIEVKTLREVYKWSYAEIAAKLGYTQRQVQTACSKPTTPKKRRGKVAIDTPTRRRIKDWLEEDPARQRLGWHNLPMLIPGLGYYGESAITTAMRTLGYRRRAR
ncbi:hypothetical protein F4861DRAFT_66119 [Xylaria intraflava]|nr:hypothetical protein F4861DRAFT_66119 [Xylaria intraflava]